MALSKINARKQAKRKQANLGRYQPILADTKKMKVDASQRTTYQKTRERELYNISKVGPLKRPETEVIAS